MPLNTDITGRGIAQHLGDDGAHLSQSIQYQQDMVDIDSSAVRARRRGSSPCYLDKGIPEVGWKNR